VSRFVSSLDSRTSDAAVDALGRLPSLSLQTRQHLHQLSSSDTWQNHASERTKKALTALLQLGNTAGCAPEHTAAANTKATSTSSWTGGYANLTSDPLVAGAKGFNCERGWTATETKYEVPLFNYVQVLGKSDVHWARVRAMAGFTAAPNVTESYTTPETIAFSITAALETKIYGRWLTPFKTGFEKNIGGQNDNPVQFFIEVLGFRVVTTNETSGLAAYPEWNDLKGNILKQGIATINSYVSTPAAALTYQTANSVCGGKFDFTWAGGSGSIDKVHKHGAVTMSASHTQSFYSFYRVVCFSWVCIDVSFDFSGTVKVQPGFYWNRCDSSSGIADAYLLGVKPSGNLVLTLELGGTTGFARAGAGGALTLLKAAIPMYGRYTKSGTTEYTKSGSTCGSVDISAGAFSGKLFLYLDFFNPFLLSWERVGQRTFLSWTAPALLMQLATTSCELSSRCTWNWQTPFNLKSRKYPNECMYPEGGYPGKNKEVFFKGAGCNGDKKFTLEAIPAGDGTFYLQSSKSGYCMHPSGSSGLENEAIDLVDEQDAMEEDLEEDAQCKKDTGGTCGWLPCYDWRHASCAKVEGKWKCMCGANKCAVWTKHAGGTGVHDNVCVEQPPTLAPTPAPPPAQPKKGTYVVFQAGCTEALSAIKFVKIDKGNGYFILKAKKTGMCVHPQHRQDRSSISGWILYENCDGAQLQLKETPRKENVYGYCTGKYDGGDNVWHGGRLH
jgi:hypothetical protein